ncbi:unnamed protein product, partial [marine sediment metagenome]
MSRITHNMIAMDFLRNYNKSLTRQNEYMNQLATEKKFDQVSDSSLEAIKSLELNTVISFNEKYIENAKDGISWLSITDQALSDVSSTLKYIRDLTVRAANGTFEEREEFAQEINQQKEHLIDLGNTTYNDRYIFNGTKTKVEPYTNANTAVAADYTNSTISTDKLTREVGNNVAVDINVSGQEIG